MFRGVTVGVVTAIAIAPDHRHVDVTERIDIDDLPHMGFGTGASKGRFDVPPDLRATLASEGIAGGKFVAIDFFDPMANPPPQLPFPVAERHIPATASMMKTLEDTATKAMDKLPELVDAIVAAATRIDGVVAQLQKDEVANKAAATLTEANQALAALGQTLRRFDRAALPEKTSKTLDDVSKAVATMNSVLARIDGAGRTARELDQALRAIRETAESIRALADDLERDPEMLLKGRAKARSSGGGSRR